MASLQLTLFATFYFSLHMTHIHYTTCIQYHILYSMKALSVSLSIKVLGPLSKGHDAAIAFFLGAMKIIERNETITGLKLAQMSRTVGLLCIYLD